VAVLFLKEPLQKQRLLLFCTLGRPIEYLLYWISLFLAYHSFSESSASRDFAGARRIA